VEKLSHLFLKAWYRENGSEVRNYNKSKESERAVGALCRRMVAWCYKEDRQ